MTGYKEPQVQGRTVGPVGYGMLSLSMPWAPVEYPLATSLLKTALQQGANLWNGGIHYGKPEANSLHLAKHYFQKYPEDADKVVLSIKGAFDIRDGPDGSPDGIRASVNEAFKVLGGVKTIDIFECARVDPKVPIETSINVLADMVKEGKIGGIGLSEVGAETIRKAHAVHPISAVEIELSIFTPDPLNNGIAETCNELGIPMIAYSPVGRGWLTGKLRSMDDLLPDDFRRRLPRFQPEASNQNMLLVQAIEDIAKRKGVTAAQIAIGWVCAQGAIPIPGSSRAERITENNEPAILTKDDMADITKIMRQFPIAGERYGGQQERLLNA